MKALVFSMLAIASMVACTSESDPINEVDNEKPVEIKMTAGINVVSTKSTGPIQQEDAVDDVVFVRADGAEAPTWTTATVASIDAKIAATTGAITFTPAQFYPTNGDNAYLIGYHPKEKGSLTSGVITYTGLTGQEDIMYAAVVEGTKTDAGTALEPAFNHKLTQISFQAIASTEAATAWGEVTSISLINQKTGATLALTDGALAFTGEATGAIPVVTTPTALETTATAIGEAIMVEAAQAEYKIKVVTENNEGIEISLKEGSTTESLQGLASTAYTVTLTFQGKDITATATIGEWNPGSGNGTVE